MDRKQQYTNNILNTAPFQDIIISERALSLLKEAEAEMKKSERKQILNQHTPAIKQLPNGKYYTRIGARQIQRNDLKDVEDEVINHYLSAQKSLNSLFDEYLARRKITVADTSWQKDIRYHKRYILPSPLGNKTLTSITLFDGYQFLEYCKGINPNLKQKYWKGIQTTLNNMFQFAIENGLIPENPFQNLKPKKDFFKSATKTRDCDTVFSRDEQTKVCGYAEEDAEITKAAVPLGIVVLFNLGLRIGELCALKWSDIESYGNKQYIHIQREQTAKIEPDGSAHGYKILEHCKTPSGDRRIALNNKAVFCFQRIKELNVLNGISVDYDDYIFQRHYKGKITLCNSRCFDARLRKYCEKSGMEVIKSPHDIRRTVLTNLYMANMPMKKIQEFAGHSTLQQTLDYIRISNDDFDALAYLNTLSS